MGYKYETHCHTFPVSICAVCGVEDTLKFYKSRGYDGVFITNHFIDSNINISHNAKYEDRINFYFDEEERAIRASKKVGIKVFMGVESTYGHADFLVYGLDREWFLTHPDVQDLRPVDRFNMYREAGALVIQAHPYREASYIEFIRLFPRCVDGVEIFNACNKEEANRLANIYQESYNFLPFSGSDNHSAGITQKYLGGVEFDEPINSVSEFINKIKSREYTIIQMEK